METNGKGLNKAESLASLLCGEFCNREQAFENPPLYAHIIVRIRPAQNAGRLALLLEQCYAIEQRSPYRIRVLIPALQGDQLIIENHTLCDAKRFWGATIDPKKTHEVNQSDCIRLNGCTYNVSETEQGFKGTVEPGCKCLIERKQMKTYLKSEFLLNGSTMITTDSGHCLNTHERVWGGLAGPFRFKKTKDYSDELIL